MTTHLRVDPIACDGHGNCHELLPELIGLDRWGYPIIDGRRGARLARARRPPRGHDVPEARPALERRTREG